MIPLGLVGVRYIVPVSAAIITLLVIVYFSYRQTIAPLSVRGWFLHRSALQSGGFGGIACRSRAARRLHPDSGGRDLCGSWFVGLGSAVVAAAYRVSLRGILIVITIVNLRGVREAGAFFAVPTYLFVGTLLITIVAGIFRVLLSGGHPTPVVALPPPQAMTAVVSFWPPLKVFASGCTALTGWRRSATE